VLLVADHPRTDLGHRRGRACGRVAVADDHLVAGAAVRVEHAAHRAPVERLGEPEQAGALGDHRASGARQVGDVGAEPAVGGQLLRVRLRQCTPDDQGIGALGQQLVAERVDGDNRGAGGFQQFARLGVREGQAWAARERDDRGAADQDGGRVVGGEGQLTGG
jgi:hypothetical protein